MLLGPKMFKMELVERNKKIKKYIINKEAADLSDEEVDFKRLQMD